MSILFRAMAQMAAASRAMPVIDPAVFPKRLVISRHVVMQQQHGHCGLTYIHRRHELDTSSSYRGATPRSTALGVYCTTIRPHRLDRRSDSVQSA